MIDIFFVIDELFFYIFIEVDSVEIKGSSDANAI